MNSLNSKEYNNRNVSNELRRFFLITIIVTWILWIPSLLNSNGVNVPTILLIISMMASFTPSIVGLILGRIELGKYGSKIQLKESLSLKFDKKWILVIIVFFTATAFISLKLAMYFDVNFQVVNQIPLVMSPLVFLQILIIGGAIGEEFGWRGYALEKLQELYRPFYATLILGLVWSLWHLPLFFMEGTVQSNMPIWQFMLQNTLIAYIYTWVYNHTKGSLVLMILIHAIGNTSAAIFPYWQSNLGRLIGFAVLFIAAILCINISKYMKK